MIKTTSAYARNLMNCVETARGSFAATQISRNKFPKLIKLLLGVFLFVAFSQQSAAQIAGWDFAGKLGNESPAVAATTLDANLNASSITRGGGVIPFAPSGGDVFAASDYTVGAGSLASAILNNDYLQFTINPKPGYQASLSTLDANFKRSGTGPDMFQWQYSLDGFTTAGVNIGGPISYSANTLNGDPQTQVILSAIPALQNNSNATTVTIRIYGWGATNPSGYFALGRPVSPANDLAVGGNVSLMKVHNISIAKDYVTIQNAIDDPLTLPGHIITADAGTYDEQVTINKRLTIRGSNTGTPGNGVRVAESILTGNNGAHSGFFITANDVTIDGFTVRECNGIYESGIYNGPAVSGTQIINNILTDNKIGVYPNNNTVVRYNLFDANNRPGASGGAGIYTESSNGLVIDQNEFKGHLINSAVIFAATAGGAHQNVTFTKNSVHNNNASNSMVYCVAINGGVFKENNITQPGTTAIKFAGACSNINVSYNVLDNNGTGIKIADDGYGFGANTAIQAHYNHLAANSVAGIQNDEPSLGLNATCNWYGSISGPAIGTNPGGTGSAITGTGGKVYANWLNYSTDASANIGVQLPTAVSVIPGSNTSAAVNHYRVLSNAIGCLVNNQTLTLSGTFNFGNATALAEWTKGNNQLAGDGQGAISGSGDNYSIAAPDSLTGVTITAASLGSAMIQGPGDIAGVALETALFFNDNDATSSFQNWTISNIIFRDLDVSILQDVNGGNTTAYNGFKIINNQFDIPEDLNATFGGETTNFQNIGINLGFGANQEISGNVFNVDGTGVSDDGVGKYSSTVVLQSTTSGGTVYDGLKIKDNTVNVTGNPDPVAPAVIRGIWENGHNSNAAIEISGNIFNNTSGGNTANLNRQTALWVTSRSGSVKKVEYKNNEISRFKEGLAWLGGLYTGNTAPDYETGAFPVEVKNNKFDATLNAVTVRKSVASTNAGSPGYMENNSFTNAVSGGFAIKNEGTGNAQSVCNWYGTTSLPAIAALNSGLVNVSSYLNSGADGPGTGFQPTGTCLTTPVHNITQNIYYFTIQSAVNAANNGDSITVASGTYVENVVVNKSVTILGPNAAIDPCTGVRVAEAIVKPAAIVLEPATTGAIFRLGSGSGHLDITIKGLTIDGSNPALGAGRMLNGVAVHTGAGIVNSVGSFDTNPGAYDVTMNIQNNIIQNLERYGVLADNIPSRPAVTGTIVSHNKIDNLPSGFAPHAGGRGRGIAFEENHYGTASYNCISRVNVGWQDDNYNLASPGAGTIVSNNTISSYHRGIFHNLQYQNATNATITDNIISAESSNNSGAGFGVEIASIQTAVGATVSGNNVTGKKYGILLWNNPTSSTINVSGGTLTNNDYGIYATNVDPQFGDAASSIYVIDGVNVQNSITAGILVDDNAANANNATIAATIQANTVINNPTTGLLINGGDAAVTFSGATPAAFTGQALYINQTSNGTNAPSADMDATVVLFDGLTGATATVPQNFTIEDKIVHKIDNSALGFVLVKSGHDFVTTNSFAAPATTSALVQRAVDAATTGFTVNVANGTYNGDLLINKSLTLLGQSTAAIIRGLYAGATKTVTVSASSVTVKDVTITRDFGISFNSNPGNDWASSLKTEGIIAENVSNLTLDHIIVRDNRNGVYIHSVPGFIVRNSTIRDNRTGFQIWGNLDNGQVINNFINSNFTHGLLVNFDQGPTTGNNLLINNNDISGNWQSQLHWQNGGAPGSNVGSFAGFNANCNWYGSPFPVYNATNASYPGTGYTDQVPTQFGGTDPGIASDIRGQEAAIITYQPYLQTGADVGGDPNDGFQPAGSCIAPPTRLYVNDTYVGTDVYTTASGSDATGQGTPSAPFATITRAIAGAQPGDTIFVDGGTYRENVVVNKDNLDFRGANYNINPNTGSRVPESIIQPAVNNASLEVVSLNTAGHHTRINGFDIDGDNTALGGGTASLGADINAGYAIRATENISGDTISNNIIRNLGVMGVFLSNTSGTATTGNLIDANKFTNILLSNGIGSYIGNNAYTTVTNNEMTAIRIGVQTGNFYNADPGNNHDLVSNTIQAQVLGIWTNLHYTNAANFVVSNNSFTNYPGDPALQSAGVRVQSIQSNVGVTVSNNNVTGNRYGVILMNNPTSNTITVQGGTLTGNGVGVWATNTINASNMNAASSIYAVNGVSIQNSLYAGIQVNDTSATTNGSTVALAVSNNTIINNSSTGLLLQGGNASATFAGATPASFTGQAKYINQITNGSTVPATAIDATAVSFDGTTGGSATLAQNFAIEDKINHKIDNSALGFVLVKTGHDFVTTNSFIAPATTSAKIQRGVDAASNGFTVHVNSGTYDGQVLVNKTVTITGAGTAARPTVDFTGTVSGKPTLFDVSVDGVVIDSIRFNTDLTKLKSAVIATGATIDNITVKNNVIDAYGTPSSGTYGDRNAVSVNYSGPTNYLVASGGVNNIIFTDNTVNGTAPDSYFRSGIAADEAGGTFTGNTLQTINHDVLVRFGSNGPITISNNNFNGGGVELSDQNAAAGPVTVSNNIFNGAFAISSAPGAAVLRMRNNYNNIPHTVSGNTFTGHDWAVSSENMNSLTFDNNTFSTAVANAHAVVVNTKSISSNSNAIVQVPVGATFTNNNFNGTGTALSFLNHDSDNDSYGAFVLGTPGNENNFASTLSSFITFDGQTGSSDLAVFPNYAGLIGTGGTKTTTMACWDQDINMVNNRLDVGAGPQLPSAMNFTQRTVLEGKLTHDPDNACLGQLIYFFPVHNLTQNTYYVTIQAAINAATASDVIECAEWTFNERVTIDKPLTLQGVDSANCVLTGTGLVGTGNGITINNGVTNVTIQKLTVKNFAGAGGNANAGIYAIGGNNNLNVDLVGILDNVGGSGFYANGPVDGVSITHVTSRGHTGGARGIVIWNGLKQNINISDNHVYGNNCCGIELQDGSASAVTMNNNNVHDNGDNGMSAVGLEGPGVNVISGNTITNNGRFGMEIKNPNGSGAAAGPGSIVVSNNTVSRSVAIVDARDIAGIAVFRRGLTGSNVDVPYGVQVNNNNVSGYVQPSNSDGFGIVMEGINHTVSGNTLTGNDVGIQRQAGHLPYPGDGDQGNLSDQYFGRGNSPISCGINISGSVFTANGADTRDVGSSSGNGFVTNTNTGKTFCTIQSAINDALTLNGHTLTLTAGTFKENVVLSKVLTIRGAGNTTLLTPATACSGNGITVSANGATVKSLRVTNYTYGVVVAANTVLLDSIESVSNCTGGIEMSNGISGLTVKNSKINNNTVMGFRAGTAAQMSGITIDSCEVKGNVQGMFIAASSGGSNSFNNIAIRNSDFSNNTQKGMYFEKLSNAVIENVVMNNSGSDATYNNNAGIDINLKYGNYSNITIQNNDITNSGALGTASDPQAPAAIAIKARDDSPSYNTVPATLTSVLIKNNLVTGPRNGIRVGEYGKINNSPTAVTIEGNDLSFAFGNKTIIKRINSNINVVCNWHGTTDLATILATFSNNGTGNIILSTTLSTGVDASPAAVGFQPAGSCTCPSGNLVTNTSTSQTFCSIQAAIDAPTTLSGHTLSVAAGTYIENVIVNKSLTILGPNAAIAPCSGARVAEAMVVPATAAIASGEIFHVAASNVTISGFTINGDNTAISSGFTSTNGADIDAAEGITVYETGVNNLTVTNNIIKNLSYFAVTLYDYPAAVPSTGHVISGNKIQDMGTYDAGSTIDLWGGGVLLYNNQYAAVTNNCMTNVRLGVQTGNFYQANPGAAGVISGNTISARRRGIFHNLAYTSASPFTLSGNTITGVADANEIGAWDGILVSSMGTGVASTLSNNNINGSAITASIPVTGISVWNDQQAPLISGGTITGVKLGINVNNFEGYPTSGSNANNTTATIDGVTVTGATIAGIQVNDNGLNTNGATVSAEIKGNNNISGSPVGILVAGADASANVHDNNSTTPGITGNTIAVDVNAGTVSPLYRNTISANATGVRVTAAGVLGLTTENFITNNTTEGIHIDASAGTIGNINSNNISGNPAGFAINNYSVPLVNATCNWWGVTGGNALVTTVGGAGTSYAPWLHSAAEDGDVTNGFQPTGACSYDQNLYVNDNSNTGNFYTSAPGNDNNPGVPAAPFRTIGKAIAVAQPTGNTVWADPGNYAENLVVNKEISFKGRKAGANVNPRFGAFTGLKADTDVETVVTAPVSDPLNNPNDLVKVLSNNITFDGFVFDGNNPALAGASTVQDNTSLDIDSRRVFTNIDAANGFNPVNNLVIKNNIMQNVAQRGVSLSNNGPLSTGILIDSNLIRNYGWDPAGGQAVILFTNAYADITHNTIDVPNDQIGLHLQNFFSNGTMNWSNNNVTVGQDAIGIHANLFYAPTGVLNIQDNTVNARTGVTGASDFTWGINLWSVQAGATVNVSNNTVGSAGGELGRGINLWNLPTSNLVTVSGGTVGKSAVGINLDNVDPYFGVGSNTMVNITGNPIVTAASGQTGIRARSATVATVAPGGSVTLNLNKATVNTSGTAIGVEVDAPSANLSHTATVYLAGGTAISGGSSTPVSVNGNQAQLYAGASSITAPATGANNAIKFSGITAANVRENLVLAGGTTINMNANTAARAFASPQYAVVEMDAASGWAVPSKIAGGLQTVQVDGTIKFSNGILSTPLVTDTIEFGNNAADIMTGANPEKASSYILGNAKMLSRAVNNGAVDMLGVNLAAEAGAPANLGNLVITRRTTNAGSINPSFTGDNSIRTVWNINPGNLSASRSNVKYRYLNTTGNINGQVPSSIYAYRYTGGVWNKISASLNSTLVGDVYTTSSFNAPGFSPWTLSSAATSPDVTPFVFMDDHTYPSGDFIPRDFIVEIDEIAGVATSGPIQFRITKPASFNISFVGLVNGVSNVGGGTPNNNADFTFQDLGGFYLVTTTASIPANGFKVAGFRISRKSSPAVPANTTNNIGITILSGSGGDNSNGNNITFLQVTAN